MPSPVQIDADKQSANATATSLTITKPTNLADNDVLYAEISRDNSDANDAITAPSGWTVLDSAEVDNGTYTCGIYRKVIISASGEPADYTWSWNSSEKVCGWIIRVTGVDNTTPEDVTPSNNTGDSNAPRCLSVATVTTNTLILAVGGMNSKGAPNWTAPTGMSEFFDIASTGGGGASSHVQAGAAEVNQAGTGATGDKDFTTVDTAEWVAFLIVVRPADPSDPPDPPTGLPTTIVSAPGIQGYSPSWKSSADNFYIVARTTNTTLDVYKATDPEVSFADAQDTANNPSTGGNTYTVLSVTQKDYVLYIASFEGTALYQYHEFNMATDTWSITDETIEDIQDDPLRPWISIAVRSDGDVIVVYAGDRDKVGGINYPRADCARRESGVWTVGIAVDSGGKAQYDNPNIIKGPLTDDMHIYFRRKILSPLSTVWQARTLDPSNSLSTVSTDSLDHNIAILGMNNAVSYDDAGTQRILIASMDATGNRDRVYAPATEDASDDIVLGTTATHPAGVDVEIAGPGTATGIHSIAELDGEIHHLFAERDINDLYYTTSKDNGATWGLPLEEIDAITVNFISANIYVRGIDTVLAYVYEDDGKQLYNEKVLIAGQTHQMMM